MGFPSKGLSSFQSAQGGVSGFNPAQGSTSAPPSTLLDGLKWFYKFDTDSTWPDAVSGGSYWTEVSDPTTVTPGVISLGIDVGTSRNYLDYAYPPSNLLIDPDKSWTQSIWFKPIAGEPTGGSYTRDFAAYEWQMIIGMTNRATGNFLYNTAVGSGGSGWYNLNLSGTPASEYADGVWGFAVFTYLHKDDGGGGTNSTRSVIARVGGVEYTASYTWAGVNYDIYSGAGASGARVGGYPNSYSYDAGSYLDLWGFWDRILTSDERDELYNSGAGKQYPF